MSKRERWVTLNSVIEPAIIYPMVTVSYTRQEFHPIQSGISQLQCAALGLNRNFSHAVLHSSPLLGGLGIPSPTQKNTKDGVNCFFYNIRRDSIISKKLAISIIYTQLESGCFQQFFTCSFLQYGHLVTQTFCVQMWS
jgi:hypothetical protein